VDNKKSTTVYTFIIGDLFHINHIKFLELAKTYGDKLIVGVLSDDVAKSYKGTLIYPLEDRFKIVNALKCVDRVVVQHAISPLEVVKTLLPDVVVCTDNWMYNFPDKKNIESLGTKIEFTPCFKDITTSEVIRRCKTMKPRMQGNEANLKEALFKFKDMMNDHGIEFILLYGALLGAYRNKRLLPWDADIDIGIIFKDYEDFADTDIFGLLRNAYREGFKDARWAHEFIVDTQYLKYPEIASLPKKKQWREFLRVDQKWKFERFGMHWYGNNPSIGLLKERNGAIYVDCLVSVKGIHELNDWYDGQKLGQITLYDETFNTPSDIESYLSNYYGKNWKDVFCSYELWEKHHKVLREGIVPQEVEDFMNKWKPLMEDM
jgi:cytidyltransferase-like protein